MTDRSEAEKAAREALKALEEAEVPATAQGWADYSEHVRLAQRALGRALGQPGA